MTDKREAILQRLVKIAAGVDGVVTAVRNQDEISEHARPAIAVFDADETADERAEQHGHPRHAPNIVEMTPEIMILLGALPERVEIMSKDSIRGEVKFVATNDVGPRWDLQFYNVEFSPSGSFNPISDEWNQIEVTGEVLLAPAGHAQAGKIGIAQLTNLPPP